MLRAVASFSYLYLIWRTLSWRTMEINPESKVCLSLFGEIWGIHHSLSVFHSIIYPNIAAQLTYFPAWVCWLTSLSLTSMVILPRAFNVATTTWFKLNIWRALKEVIRLVPLNRLERSGNLTFCFLSRLSLKTPLRITTRHWVRTFLLEIKRYAWWILCSTSGNDSVRLLIRSPKK